MPPNQRITDRATEWDELKRDRVKRVCKHLTLAMNLDPFHHEHTLTYSSGRGAELNINIVTGSEEKTKTKNPAM